MVNFFVLQNPQRFRFRRHQRTIAVTMTLKWRDCLGNWHDCDVEMDADGKPVEYMRFDNHDNAIPQYNITNISGYPPERTKLADKSDMRWFDSEFRKWAVE